MITISHLSKHFEKRPVIDDLSLTVSASDRIALVGSNGAGKTTLFRCLLGHYTYTGRIAFDAARAGRRDADVLSRIAFVPQLPPPLRMPVGELLAFASGTGGASRSDMGAIAERLGINLDEVARRQFYRLSGGQKQKILITIALARRAELLIFDEPAANLDPVARRAFIDLLSTRKDCAMLIASHRLEEVAPLVNRVIELDSGKIALDDAVADRLKTGDLLNCSVSLHAAHEPFSRMMKEWNFTAVSGLSFTGQVPAAEAFRFLSVMSRYAGIIATLSVDGRHTEIQ
jgi:ABC-2 type transport system ATP-binding protein